MSGGKVSGGKVSGGKVSGGKMSGGKVSHYRPQTPDVCKTHCKPIIYIFIWFKNLNLKHFKL